MDSALRVFARTLGATDARIDLARATLRIGEDAILLDPFNAGTMLTHEACAELVARAVGRRGTLHDEHFAPVSKRQFLIRMLNNLKAVYWQQQEWRKTLAIIDRLLVADDTSLADVRDRGAVLHK